MNSMPEAEKEPVMNLAGFTLLKSRLWPYLSRYKLELVRALVFVFFSTVANLLTPWIIGRAVDIVIVPKQLEKIHLFAAAVIGINLFSAFFSVLQNVALTAIGQKVLHDIRQDLLKKYLFYPVEEFNRVPAGRMVTRLVNDTSSLQDLFTGGVAVAFANMVMICGVIVWLFVLHPSLALVSVSVAPFMIWGSRHFGAMMRKNFRAARNALSVLNSFLSENIAGMWLIQIFNKQPRFRKRFEEASRHYTQQQLNTVNTFAYFQPFITVLTSLSMALLIWYGGYSIIAGTLTLGILVAFIGYIQSLFAPVRDMTEKVNLFVSAMASTEKIFEFMDRDCENGINVCKDTLVGAARTDAPSITFDHVSFEYEKAKPILKELSFEIKAGEKIGIVGHTGAGKTTITALLMRFYDPVRGKILLDQQDILTFDKRVARSRIGYIQQEPFLFSGTVADNIFLWDENARARYDKFPDFVRKPFESGRLSLDTEIYEKGANLSSGEKQIIAFLRAMVHDPSVIILDEATAHLDLLTEQWIARASAELFRNRTVIIIAHRLATLNSVDRIFVMHKGELIEQGTHEQLLAAGGVFARLYEFQKFKQDKSFIGL